MAGDVAYRNACTYVGMCFGQRAEDRGGTRAKMKVGQGLRYERTMMGEGHHRLKVEALLQTELLEHHTAATISTAYGCRLQLI